VCYKGLETKGSDDANRSDSQKTDRNTDWRLKLISMKLEQVVIGDQNASVNMILSVGLTARQCLETVWKRSER
jgi:hypothetical protein